jgi:hypothetical protein
MAAARCRSLFTMEKVMMGLTLCEQVSLGFMILHLFSCYPSKKKLWEISVLFHRSVSVLWFTIVTSLSLSLSLCSMDILLSWVSGGLRPCSPCVLKCSWICKLKYPICRWKFTLFLTCGQLSPKTSSIVICIFLWDLLC